MTAVPGYFLVLDRMPTVGGDANASFTILGQAEYIVTKSGGFINDSNDEIDATSIVSSAGYSTTNYGFSVEMSNGATLYPRNNDESPIASIVFFELEDGRVLMSFGSASATNSLSDEIVQNGYGVETLTLGGGVVIGSGGLFTSSHAYTMPPTGTKSYDGSGAPCFTTGTLIDTDRGAIKVEDLQTGDMIRTMDHGLQPVKWVGASRVHDAPVRIKAGTFNNTRDMVVSPRHRMLLAGWQIGLLFNHDTAFAAAGDLKNNASITQEPEGWVEYYHILLDNHEVIFAEGAATESFFPDAASLQSMTKATRAELTKAVDLTTYTKTARPTLTANQAMYVGHNLDVLEDEQAQMQAAE